MNTYLRHAVVGLPGSGKTTYLAALWHLLSSEELDLQLDLRSVAGDTGYLNSIAEKWRSCLEIGRTRSLEAEYITLMLFEKARQMNFDLCFPDVAGESFEEQLAIRRHASDHAEWLRHPGGTLLFLNASSSPDGLTLQSLAGLLDDETESPEEETEVGQELQGSGAPSENAESTEALQPVAENGKEYKTIPWHPKFMPEQVKLVELLQILGQLDRTSERSRISVLVSAWDTVKAEDVTPETWLSRERPLLLQFLEANSNRNEYRIFGISAQGGNEKTDRYALLAKPSPSERVICVENDTKTHDLTRPIVWLNGSA